MINLSNIVHKQQDYIIELSNRWKNNRGIGTFINLHDRFRFVEFIHSKMIDVHRVVNVVVKGDTALWYNKVPILESASHSDSHIRLLIIDNISVYDEETIKRIIESNRADCLFVMGFLNDSYTEKDEKKLIHCPVLNAIKRIDNNIAHEYYISISLNKEEQTIYDTFNASLKGIATKFNNDHKLIQSLLTGDKSRGMSGGDCRWEFAESMGWSKDADLTIPYNQEIERLYNPNNIYDTIKDYNDYIRKRNSLVAGSISKLNVMSTLIIDCLANKRKFVVLSNSSSLAIDLWYLHQECGIFCNQAPAIEIGGRSYGKEALKTAAVKGFKSNTIPGIITANVLDDKWNVDNVDVVIYTSPDCDTVNQILDKGRVKQFDITSSAISVYVYTLNTKEEAQIKEVATMSNSPQTFINQGFKFFM